MSAEKKTMQNLLCHTLEAEGKSQIRIQAIDKLIYIYREIKNIIICTNQSKTFTE